MRTLNEREKRTVRIAGMGIAVYLALFFGFSGWRYLQRTRAEYVRLVRDAEDLRRRLQVYEDKALVAQDLMTEFRMDPASLSRTSLVAEATAAIYKAAMTGGIALGPIRESATVSGTGSEAASVQLEGMGPAPAILAFLHGLNRLGYPLVADNLQLTQAPGGPGQVKMNLTLMILDYQRWTPPTERSHGASN